MTDNVLSVVNRSNQRGGRMLSVVDLVQAGTIERLQCAWLLHRILDGGSWLVGARPGGAGKTTVMSALLAMVPEGTRVHVTDPDARWLRAAKGDCVVAYEISPGPYDGYIWGDDVRRLTELGVRGVRIVANLHADTLAEAKSQLAEQCGAGERGLAAFGVFVPILAGTRPSERPVVERLQQYVDDAWSGVDLSGCRPARERHIATFLDDCQRLGRRTCEDVRGAWVEWLRGR